MSEYCADPANTQVNPLVKGVLIVGGKPETAGDDAAHTTQMRRLPAVVMLLYPTAEEPADPFAFDPYPPMFICTGTIPDGGGGGGGGGAPPIDSDTEARAAPTATALLGFAHAGFDELRLAAVCG